MRNLKYRKIQEVRLFKRIANAKQPPRNNRLIQAIAMVTASYKRYQKNIKSLHQYSRQKGLSTNLEEALIHSYESETVPLKQAKEKIQEQLNSNYKCPYCDVGNAKKSFDHFLPKEDFPELSTLTKNLIPSCVDCNTKKSTLSHVKRGNVEFFNPYFDSIPNQKFLFCKIVQNLETKKLEAVFFINRPNGLSQAHFLKIKNHFDNLSLLNLYKEDSINILSELQRELYELNINLAGHALNKNTFIQSKFNALNFEYGINHYKTAIFDELKGPSLVFL